MLLQLFIILFQYGIICHKSRWSERLIVRVNLYIILNVRTYLTALLYICISKKENTQLWDICYCHIVLTYKGTVNKLLPVHDWIRQYIWLDRWVTYWLIDPLNYWLTDLLNYWLTLNFFYMFCNLDCFMLINYKLYLC